MTSSNKRKLRRLVIICGFCFVPVMSVTRFVSVRLRFFKKMSPCFFFYIECIVFFVHFIFYRISRNFILLKLMNERYSRVISSNLMARIITKF